MANIKEYKIVINGLEESINAVDSLNKQLDALEKRINALQSKSVNIGVSSTSSSGGRSSNASALSAEEATQREINKLKQEGERLDAKIVAAQDEIYKRVDATKQLYKETVADQKAIAAQERLVADAYSNTMQGMKAKLADIKSVINTTDLGDSDKIKQMTQEANELTSKLKEMEAAYGQYGRNVGNYANGVAEGLQKVKINVGGVVREFGSAREASRTLNNELKSMAVNGQQDTEAFKELRQVVMELESNINDAKKPMDNLMDSMEGIMAVANVGQGLRALFGVDDTEIQKSIQKLVALQNALKGIETINKQIQTREGVGKWIAPFTTQIDAATKKMLVFNRALLGTSKAAKVAAVGIKAFGTALKTAVSMGILVAVDLLIEKLLDLVESFKKVDKAAEAAKEAEEEVSKAYANGSATLLKYQTIVKNFNGSKEEEEKLVKELNSELGSSLGTYKTLGEWMDVLTKKGQDYINMLVLQAKAQAAFNNLVKAQQDQMNASNASTEDYRTFINDVQDFLWTGWGTSSANKARVAAKQSADAYAKTAEEEFVKAQKEVQAFMQEHHIGDYAPQLEKNGKNSKKTIENVEAELAKARIAAMKEGLNKTILQLEEERKQRLAKLNRNAKDYKQQEAQWNQYYNDRILDETEKWSKNMNKAYSDLYSAISSYATNNLKMVATETKEELERALKSADDVMTKYADKMAGYGLFGDISSKSQASLGIMSSYAFKNNDFVSMAKQYIDLEREAIKLQAEFEHEYAIFQEVKEKLTEGELKLLEKSLDGRKKYYESLFDEAKAVKERLNDIMNQSGYGYKDLNGGASVPGDDLISTLYEEGYAKKISDIFDERIAIQKKYWNDVERITKEGAEKEKKARLDVLYKEQQEEDSANLTWRDKTLQETLSYYKELREGYDAQFKNGLMPKEEYMAKTTEAVKRQEEDIKSIYEEYNKRILNIEKNFETERQKIIKDSSDKVKKVTVDELTQRMTELRDFQTQINNKEQKQPVVNAWGITNWKETKKNYEEIKDSYISLGQELAEVRDKAIRILGDDTASKELKDQAESILREARNMAAGIGETLDEIEDKMSNWTAIQTFVQDMQVYFQEVMQSFQTIMQAVWQAQDNAFEKEQDELDKWNEELDKKLDEQQDIVEKHKDAIDSIEEELGSARGDRRQHLIDQINAEVDAQRTARKEEQRLEKEKEKAQKKQDALELKRKKAQYNRDMLQAIVNGAMAVTYAAMNSWPVPAIPMMALAGATTAAQIAIMASNKPYAKGGLLEGKSHAEGGIPIPGTGIEVEGKEYVIRKKSTAPNIDILDYINKSERKLTLDDFIDFYSSGKFKKNISSISPRSKFADGGTMPLLPSNIELDDRLINAMEDYSNRPVVVEVKEILNKAESIRAVQTLAGLTPTY